jgi:hypothetical protein
MRRGLVAITIALGLAVVGAHAQDYYKSGAGGGGFATNPATFTGDLKIVPDSVAQTGNILFLGGSTNISDQYAQGIFWGDGTANQYAKYAGLYGQYSNNTLNLRGYVNTVINFGFGTQIPGEIMLRTPLALDDLARTIVVAAPIAYGVNVAFSPVAATIAAGFGTGATIAGTANGGRIVVGTTPGAGGTITLGAAFTSAPACWVQNETTGSNGISAPTTTTLVVSGLTLVAAQTVVWGCNGGF